MKILQLNPAFYPALSYGGVVNVSFNISKTLVKRGHNVTVFTSYTLSKKSRQISHYSEHEGVKIFYFRNVSNLLAWHRFLFYPGLVLALKNHTREFDIIHMHGTRNFQNIVAVHYAKKYNIPYLVQPHGSLPISFGKQSLKRIYDRIWGKKILQGADKVIALTVMEAEQAMLLGVEENRIQIIANGIDLDNFITMPSKGEFRKSYSISDSANVVLYLGRLHESKGLGMLVKAFSAVLCCNDNSVLVLAGPDDGDETALKNQVTDLGIDDKVITAGYIDEKMKLKALIDSDVFVTPTFSGFPITFLEALMCGTPVITTELGDKIDWLNGIAGKVVTYDANSLKDAIIEMLSNKEMRKSYGNNGKKLVYDRFNWEVICEQLEVLYKNIIFDAQGGF